MWSDMEWGDKNHICDHLSTGTRVNSQVTGYALGLISLMRVASSITLCCNTHSLEYRECSGLCKCYPTYPGSFLEAFIHWTSTVQYLWGPKYGNMQVFLTSRAAHIHTIVPFEDAPDYNNLWVCWEMIWNSFPKKGYCSDFRWLMWLSCMHIKVVKLLDI